MPDAHILVVEDHSVVARDLRNRLESLGYTVAGIVTSGEEAIQKTAECSPDLVLMDIMLRGEMDGIEAAARIRQRFDVPVIYLAAHSDEITLQRAKVTGPFGYLLKPYEERDLHTTIEMALYRHEMERQLKESEVKARGLLEAAPDPIAIADSKGQIVIVNTQIEKVFGYKRDELLGQPIEILLPKRFHERHVKHREVYSSSPHTRPMGVGLDLSARRKDGSEFPVEVSLSPMESRDGLLVISVIRDITKRKQAEAEIIARNLELATLNTLASELNRLLDLRQTLDSALEQTLDLLGLTAGWVVLLDEESGQFKLATVRGLPAALAEEFHWQAALCECQRRFLSGELSSAANILGCERLIRGALRGRGSSDPLGTKEVGELTVHASVPLRIGQRGLGIMNLASSSSAPFTSERLYLLTAIGRLVAVAVERARLYEAERERTAELMRANALIAVLGQTAARIQAVPDPDYILEALGTQLKQLGITCAVALLEPETGALVVRYTSIEPAVLAQAEELTGVSARGFRLSREDWPRYADLVERRRALFVSDLEPMLFALLGRFSRPASAEDILGMVGVGAEVRGIYLPLTVEEQARGVLIVWGEGLEEDDVSAVSIFAGQVAAALEVARLHEQVKAQRVEEQAALLKLSQALLGEHDSQAVMEQAIAVVDEVFRPELCKILLLQGPGFATKGSPGRANTDGGEHLWLAAGRGWEPDLVGQATVPAGTDSQAGYTLASRGPIAVEDFSRETRFSRLALLGDHDVMAGMSAPMLAGERAIGVLGLHWRSPRPCSEDEMRLLALIANSTAQALERARLFEAEREQRELSEALRDTAAALTSTLNLDEVLERILSGIGRVVPHDSASVMLVESGVAYVARWRGYPDALPSQGLRQTVTDPSASPSGTGQALRQAGLDLRMPVDEVPSLRQMVETGQPVVIPETHGDPNWMDFPETRWVRSYASAPIRLRGEVIGFLNINSATPGFFTPAHAERLLAFADQAAIAVENARLYGRTDAQLQQTHQRLALANQIARHLSAILDMDQLLVEVVRLVQDYLGYSHISVALVEADELVFRAAASGGRTVPTDSRLKVGQGIVGWVAAQGKAVRVPDVTRDPRYDPHPALSDTRSKLAVPIQLSGCVLGVLNAESDQLATFDEGDEALLQAIADQLALALQNARSYRDAQEQRDEATAVAETLFEQTERMVSMNRVATALLAVTDPDEAARTFVNNLRDEMDVQKSLLWLASFETGGLGNLSPGQPEGDARGEPVEPTAGSGQDSRLRLAAATGLSPGDVEAAGQNSDCPALTRVWRTGQYLTSRQFDQEFAQEAACAVWDDYLEDWLMLPVKAHNEVLGVLVTEREALDEDTLRIFINQAALGLAAARSYRQLQETNTQLASAIQAKTNLLNFMSHEVRNPLTAIIGFVELLLGGHVGSLTEIQENFIERILRSSQHMADLVSEVLDLSKLEAGKLELRLEEVQIAELYNDVAGMVSGRAEENGLELITEPVDPDLRLMGDATRLRQILLNLLTNAIKFTAEGGKVVLRAEAQEGPEGRREIVLSVADTGIGIKPEDFAKVFGEFEQIDDVRTRSLVGTGLGMPLTKQLVEMHKGRIWFESTYGEGTTFFVALPL